MVIQRLKKIAVGMLPVVFATGLLQMTVVALEHSNVYIPHDVLGPVWA